MPENAMTMIGLKRLENIEEWKLPLESDLDV